MERKLSQELVRTLFCAILGVKFRGCEWVVVFKGQRIGLWYYRIQ